MSEHCPSPGCLSASHSPGTFMKPASITLAGEQRGNHSPPDKAMKKADTLRGKSLRILNLTHAPRCGRSWDTWPPGEGQLALSSVHPGRCQGPVGTARKGERDAEASCHQVPVAHMSLLPGSPREGVQLQGQKCPKEINRELINIRPIGDKCQTIGQQGAPCLRDPS